MNRFMPLLRCLLLLLPLPALAAAPNCPSIGLAPASLPGGAGEDPYNLTLTAANAGAAPTFALASGALPTGLTLAANGVLSGAPTEIGAFTVAIVATDPVTFCSGGRIYLLTIVELNHPPSFTGGANVNGIAEDSPAQTVPGWATAISQGIGDSGQTLSFSVTNNTDPTLFVAGPTVDPATGDLAFTPAADANGTASITLVLSDDGGMANGGMDTSAPYTFTIAIDAVNDAPSFTKGADQITFENAPAQTVNGWASEISAGPANEASQTLTFDVTGNSNPGLFSAGPAVAADGTLTYTPTSGVTGNATLSLVLRDNGGTSGGGVDTSAVHTFTITVGSINHAPSFTKGADQSVLEDAAPQNIAGWATAISQGSGDSGQALTFQVTGNTNAALFAVAPAVSPAGDLGYTLAPNANGSATITLVLHDDGGTGNGGVDTSAPQTFVITAAPVNDAPSFSAGGNVSINEDSGAYSAAWATGASAGPSDESGQTLTFEISGNTNAALFTAGPTVAPNGTLSFTPAANTAGTATITLVLHDSGGTANGGADTSAVQNFVITVTGINDAPSFTAGGNVSVNEDSGVYSAAWATAVSAGPPDESGQTLAFQITANSNPGLFSAGPAIAANGALSFTPATNANGSATITVQLVDNGGTANSGVDTSAPASFTIAVNAVNDAPAANAVTITGYAHIPMTLPAATLGGTDTADIGSAVSIDLAPTGVGGAVVTLSADGSFSYTPPPGAVGNGAASFQYRVCDNGVDNGNTLASLCSPYATVTVDLQGPAIYFVKSASSGNCTLGNECTFANAVSGIGASTGRVIFIADANTHTGNVTLNANGKLVGQGVSASDFDSLFGINPASITPGATLAARPSVNQTRPTLNGGVTMHNNSHVRGLNLNASGAAVALAASSRTGLVVDTIAVASQNGDAVNFNGSSGTFAFDNVSAVAGKAFVFASTTSAATVTAQDVSSSTNSAVDISAAGTTDFSFHSVNSGTAAAGATGSGVSVQTAGDISVTGTGSTAGSGGTLRHAGKHGLLASSVTSLSLKNMVFTQNGSSQNVPGSDATCGGDLRSGNNLQCVAGIMLVNAGGIALDNVSVTNNAQMGINGNNVSGFTLTNAVVSNNGNEAFENGLTLQNVFGVADLTNVVMTDNAARQIYVSNSVSNALTFNLSGTAGSTWLGHTAPLGALTQQALLFEGLGNANMTLNVDGVIFANHRPQNAVDVQMMGNAVLGGHVNSSTFSTNVAAIAVATQNAAGGKFNLSGNTISQASLQGIVYAAAVPSTGTLQATIANNTFNGCIAGTNCNGIQVDQASTAVFRVKLDNNQIHNVENIPLQLQAATAGSLDAIVTNNTIDNPAGPPNSRPAMYVNSGVASGATAAVCLDASTNTISGNWLTTPVVANMQTRFRNGATLRLPSYAGGPTDSSAVQVYLQNRNPGAGVAFSSLAGTSAYQSGNCTAPTP